MQKLVLSRKGFDSSWGGGPSPILPDGRLMPLPIPGVGWRTYDDLDIGDGRRCSDLMGSLGYRTVTGYDNAAQVGPRRLALKDARAHLDPDLIAAFLPRRPTGWRGLLGQTGGAAGHLRNQEIGPGDIFLFFGLFRRTRSERGAIMWDERSSPEHVIWGYLEVDTGPHDAWSTPPEGWMADHAHFRCSSDPGFATHNDVYVSSRQLSFAPQLPGWGAFATYRASCCDDVPGLRLTRPDGPLTVWRLPLAFHPMRAGAALTYHPDPGRWSTEEGHSFLKSVHRGQEFVIERTDAIEEWLRHLIAANAHRSPQVLRTRSASRSRGPGGGRGPSGTSAR